MFMVILAHSGTETLIMYLVRYRNWTLVGWNQFHKLIIKFDYMVLGYRSTKNPYLCMFDFSAYLYLFKYCNSHRIVGTLSLHIMESYSSFFNHNSYHELEEQNKNSHGLTEST